MVNLDYLLNELKFGWTVTTFGISVIQKNFPIGVFQILERGDFSRHQMIDFSQLFILYKQASRQFSSGEITIRKFKLGLLVLDEKELSCKQQMEIPTIDWAVVWAGLASYLSD